MWLFLERILGVAITAALKSLVDGVLTYFKERQQRQDQKDLGKHEQSDRQRAEAEEARARMADVPRSDERSTVDRLRDHQF